MKQSMSYIRLIAFSMTLSIFSLVSCESGLDFALDKAGENRGEMEKVLEYFRNDLDPLKYEAAQFLISNMPYHYSYSGDVVEQYDSIYLEMAKYPVQKRDSVLAAITENLDLKSARVITDIRSLTADYLIKAINDAFETWKNTPWHETYDKSLFFNYVLPYRLTQEQPSDWREEIERCFPYLSSDFVISRRGMYYEAEDADLRGCREQSLENASQRKIVDLDNSDAEVSFQLSSPLNANKQIWLRYASVSENPEISVIVNGRHVIDSRLQPTVFMQELRDSRFGIPIDLQAGENTLTIKYKSGRILLDRIMVSAIEPIKSDKSKDFTSSLYRIRNAATGNYITFDTVQKSLLNLIRLLPLEEKTDSSPMLRFDFKGEQCWSISSFRRDSMDLCIEARYCSTDVGAPMSQYHYQGGFHQRWIIIPCGMGTFKIMGKDSGLFLESATNEDGDEILIQTPFADKETQKWDMEICGANTIPNPHYQFGSAIAEAMKVYDRIGQFEWMKFKGPIPPKTASLIKAKTGHCVCEASFTVSLCRYLGIPAAIDFTPNYGNRNQGHTWSVLINPDGTSTLFHNGFAPGDSVYFVRDYVKPKVYRHQFQLNRKIADDLKGEKDVPRLFRNADFIDVTEEYCPVTDVTRTVPANVNGKIAYICVFDNKDWVPIDYARISGRKATFRLMGRNVAYIAATFKDGNLKPFGNPFIINSDGNIREIVADKVKCRDMTVLRKYPFMSYRDPFNHRMEGGRFEASDNSKFRDASLLHTHKGITNGNWYDVNINDDDSYLYIRYIGPNDSYCNINEIEFIGECGNILHGEIIGTSGVAGKEKEKVFDGDILSGFEGDGPDGHWIGLKLDKPQRIDRIRYIPRTDGNCIEIDDQYELLYWDDNRWVSIGKKIADSNSIVFPKVPIGGLYLVRDLTKGKEERIFTYEDMKQIWW